MTIDNILQNNLIDSSEIAYSSNNGFSPCFAFYIIIISFTRQRFLKIPYVGNNLFNDIFKGINESVFLGIYVEF